ncbi:two-component system capsular synthesis response regulator RcsB [Silvimonas terrae]|uniref:Two-component system capsular synthesis response regulator RcsB n=1 Tax=Silvimonas terrae TaxID=300266 RepID=A0A840RHG9_9NEIS|nr:response regulator transcription factor [Silvimonas terrae]MBB5191722.1 two-component system capsular synthesis response regulator RcsB [Silvimonas terrae]
MSDSFSGARIVIADDHPIILQAISSSFEDRPGFSVIGKARDGLELIGLLEKERVDLIVTDLVMEAEEHTDFDGLRLVNKLRRTWPDVPVVVFTQMMSGSMFHELTKLGVAAIVSKEELTQELASTCERVLTGNVMSTGEILLSPRIQMRLAKEGSTARDLGRNQPLSPKELEVVRLFAQGMSVTEISRTLNRSVPTIATQKRSAMRKLHVENHVGLIKYAAEAGLI